MDVKRPDRPVDVSDRTCPKCGSGKLEVVWRVENPPMMLVKCVNCGHISTRRDAPE